MLVDINLLPERNRERSKAVIFSLVLIIAGMLFWLTFFIMANRNADEAERLDATTQEVRIQGAEIRSSMEGTETMADREKLELTIGWAESYQLPTAPLLRQLVSLLPARGFIVDYTYSGPHTADLSVQFDRYEQAAYYLARLKSASMIELAVMNEIVAAPLEEETDDEGNPVEPDDRSVPRYIANYTIDFVDPRLPAAGTAEEPSEATEGEETEGGEDADADADREMNAEPDDAGGDAPTGAEGGNDSETNEGTVEPSEPGERNESSPESGEEPIEGGDVQ